MRELFQICVHLFVNVLAEFIQTSFFYFVKFICKSNYVIATATAATSAADTAYTLNNKYTRVDHVDVFLL